MSLSTDFTAQAAKLDQQIRKQNAIVNAGVGTETYDGISVVNGVVAVAGGSVKTLLKQQADTSARLENVLVRNSTSTNDADAEFPAFTFADTGPTGWAVGSRVRATSVVEGSTWLEGVLTVSTSTGITIFTDATSGSEDSFSNWTLALAGGKGVNGDPGPPAILSIGSASSVAIATGSKTFTFTYTTTALGWVVGSFVLIVSSGDTANFMAGKITALSSSQVTVNVMVTGGSGTHTDWNLALTGVIETSTGTGKPVREDSPTIQTVLKTPAIRNSSGTGSISILALDGSFIGSFDNAGTFILSASLGATTRRIVHSKDEIVGFNASNYETFRIDAETGDADFGNLSSPAFTAGTMAVNDDATFANGKVVNFNGKVQYSFGYSLETGASTVPDYNSREILLGINAKFDVQKLGSYETFFAVDVNASHTPVFAKGINDPYGLLIASRFGTGFSFTLSGSLNYLYGNSDACVLSFSSSGIVDDVLAILTLGFAPSGMTKVAVVITPYNGCVAVSGLRGEYDAMTNAAIIYGTAAAGNCILSVTVTPLFDYYD